MMATDALAVLVICGLVYFMGHLLVGSNFRI